MPRFQNTELSDWLRAPRGLQILNGMTWVLPPEILLRTFGTESSGLEDDGDLDLQLDTIMMSRPIFRGISPSLPELNPLLATKIRQSVDLYTQTLYPVMNNGLVYHHMPLLPMMEPSPWVVLEYATQDRTKELVGLFRTSQSGDSVIDLNRAASIYRGIMRFVSRMRDRLCRFRDLSFSRTGYQFVWMTT